MTKICLVRHGETDWNVQGRLQGKTDIPLNETGIQQAKLCAHYFHSANWDLIVTSPLIRARKTAEIINEPLQLSMIVLDHFTEKGFGYAEGLTIEEKREQFPTNEVPNMESPELLRKRLKQGIEIIQKNYSEQNIILVAHGAVINALLAIFSENIIGTGKTSLANASLSTILYSENKWNIEDFNQINHLNEKIH
ncbi:putative phosphatase [Bacillus sp. TS-2]|nr:putative phosphatase [Bacillus sp. TS-2]